MFSAVCGTVSVPGAVATGSVSIQDDPCQHATRSLPLPVLTPSRRLSLPKALPVFARRNERLDHFSLDVVAVELIQLGEPEVVAVGIRIAAEVAEVFQGDEGAI